jgi:hypothetical protein
MTPSSFLAGTIILTLGFDFILYFADHSNFGDIEIDHVTKTRKYIQLARTPILIASMKPTSARNINWYLCFNRNIDYTFVAR